MTEKRNSRIALLAVVMLLSGALLGIMSDDSSAADNDAVGFISSADPSGVSVTIINQATGDTKTASSASDGSYSFQGLADGEYSVRYSKVGSLSVLDSWNIPSDLPLEEVSMGAAPLGSTRVIVSVSDSEDQAIDGATAYLMSSTEEHSWWSNAPVGYTISAPTNATGTHFFNNLTPDTYQIRVEASGYATAFGNTSNPNITMNALNDTNKQTVRVYDQSGNPLGDATVFMYDATSSTWYTSSKVGYTYYLQPPTGSEVYIYAYHGSNNSPSVLKIPSVSGIATHNLEVGGNSAADDNVVYISAPPSHGSQSSMPKIGDRMIKESPAPSASITVTSDYTDVDGLYVVADGDQVNFSGSSSSSPIGIAQYDWSFSATGAETTNTFSTGSTEVVLTVTDTFGGISQANVTITADGTNPAPAVVVTVKTGVSDEGEAYNTSKSNVDEDINIVVFNANQSIDNDSMIVAYAWDFGDNNTDTGDVVSHVFENPGDFGVQLKVTDAAGNSASRITTITVNDIEAPRAAFNWSYTNDTGGIVTGAAMEGIPTHFNAGGTDDNSCIEHECSGDILNYTWDFGDGTDGTGVTIDHIFNETVDDGFNVILVVTDASGNQDQTTYKINPAPMDRPDIYVSSLLFSNDNPSEGETVEINATIKLLGMNLTEGFAVTFYLDGCPCLSGDAPNGTALHTVEVDNSSLVMGIENEYIVKTTWTATSGTHTIYVLVDANEMIDESEEKNDISKVITVSAVDDSRDWTSIGLIVIVVLLAFGAVGYIYRDTLFK